jgi:hypothetical protein
MLAPHSRPWYRGRHGWAAALRAAVFDAVRGVSTRALWCGFALASAALAAASPARGETEPVRIWYRSSDGCPDGAGFIDLLQRLGRRGTLATVGDRVDFVVTVASAVAQSNGRLERQSRERTVTIRDVAAESCDEVAHALALSLDLAVQPTPTNASPTALNALEQPPTATAHKSVPLGARPLGARRLGAQGTALTGLAHTVLAGASAFLDWRADPHWSTRAGVGAAWGERSTDVDLRLALWGARVEGCWVWALRSLSLGPCAGVGAGWLFASGQGGIGRHDAGFWGELVGHARLAGHLSSGIDVEAQVGALVPWVRYRFDDAGGSAVSRSARVGAQAALGLSFAL